MNFPQGVLTPDYLVDGLKFDLKEITGNKKSVIDNNTKKAKKQAENIVFDITNTSLSFEEIVEQISDVYKRGRRGLRVAIVKDGNNLKTVLKPKEKREFPPPTAD